jgi:hypothetical protein
MEERRCKALNLVLLQIHSDPWNTFSYSIVPHPTLHGDDLLIRINNITVIFGTMSNGNIIIEHTPGTYIHPDYFNVLLDTLGIPRGSHVVFRSLRVRYINITVTNKCTVRNCDGDVICITHSLCTDIIRDCIQRYSNIPIKQN